MLIIILATAFSCSKFEDGPKMSFRTVENRIYGKYRIVFFSKNDTDLTSYWNQHYNLTFDFHYDPTGSYPDIHGASVKGYIDSLGYMKYYNVSYHLGISNDEEVKIAMYNHIIDTTAYPDRLLYPLIVYSLNWPTPLFTVTRLTNDEMWLRHTNGNDVYEIHLKENI